MGRRRGCGAGPAADAVPFRGRGLAGGGRAGGGGAAGPAGHPAPRSRLAGLRRRRSCRRGDPAGRCPVVGAVRAVRHGARLVRAAGPGQRLVPGAVRRRARRPRGRAAVGAAALRPVARRAGQRHAGRRGPRLRPPLPVGPRAPRGSAGRPHRRRPPLRAQRLATPVARPAVVRARPRAARRSGPERLPAARHARDRGRIRPPGRRPPGAVAALAPGLRCSTSPSGSPCGGGSHGSTASPTEPAVRSGRARDLACACGVIVWHGDRFGQAGQDAGVRGGGGDDPGGVAGSDR